MPAFTAVPRHVLVAAALAMLGGCVSGGPPINGDVRALSPEELRLQQVETKVAELSRRVDGLDASRNGPQVSDDLRSLRGDVETLRHDFEQAQQQNQAQTQALDQRLQRLEGGAAPAAPGAAAAAPGAATMAPPAVANPTAPEAPAAAPSSGNASQEDALYNSSLTHIRAGRYDDAIRGFRSMLDQYPQGNYADNGWYWLGQAYNVKGDYANAGQAFDSLLQRFPASPKVPDALLGRGMVDVKLNKRKEAKAAFQRIVREFPNSNAASMATSQLSQLR